MRGKIPVLFSPLPEMTRSFSDPKGQQAYLGGLLAAPKKATSTPHSNPLSQVGGSVA